MAVMVPPGTFLYTDTIASIRALGNLNAIFFFFLTSYQKGHYVAISNMNHTFISQVPTKMNEPFEAACFSELAVTQDDFTPLNSRGAVRHDHRPVIISGKYVNASWPAPSLCTMFTKISTMYSGAEGGVFFL